MRGEVCRVCTAAFPVLVLSGTLSAQEAEPVRDNSLLMEEAYNQERGVVQHISLFLKERDSGNWAYTFTQEWPLWGQRHQFSYTVPVVRVSLDGENTTTGLGDLFLNYRIQAIGGEGNGPALAPRFSVILPTGSWRNQTGSGSLGLQVSIPASFVVGTRLNFHLNGGFTLLPSAHHLTEATGVSSVINGGASGIFLLTPMVNLFSEAVAFRGHDPGEDGSGTSSTGAIVDLGIRWGINVGKLQIVPAAAWAVGFGDNRSGSGLLLYLSFEHPFTATK